MLEDIVAKFQALPPIAQIGIPVAGVGGVAFIALYHKKTTGSYVPGPTIASGTSAGGGGIPATGSVPDPAPAPGINPVIVPYPNPTVSPASPGPTLPLIVPASDQPLHAGWTPPANFVLPNVGAGVQTNWGLTPANQVNPDGTVIVDSKGYPAWWQGQHGPITGPPISMARAAGGGITYVLTPGSGPAIASANEAALQHPHTKPPSDLGQPGIGYLGPPDSTKPPSGLGMSPTDRPPERIPGNLASKPGTTIPGY